jgi:hypothetical protein
VTRLPQSYETLIGSNASMHSSQQPPAAVHHYQVQERATAPVFHLPTPSPQKRRQDTLTQNEWGARPIPSGWTEHTDGSGSKFYIHRKTKKWAPTYEHMFVESEPSPLTSSNSLEESESQADSSPRKRKKARQVHKETTEVGTEMLPGSDFGRNFAKSTEANKENENGNEKENRFQMIPDENDKNIEDRESVDDESDQSTCY